MGREEETIKTIIEIDLNIEKWKQKKKYEIELDITFEGFKKGEIPQDKVDFAGETFKKEITRLLLREFTEEEKDNENLIFPSNLSTFMYYIRHKYWDFNGERQCWEVWGNKGYRYEEWEEHFKNALPIFHLDYYSVKYSFEEEGKRTKKEDKNE